jgi:hypothetical protein
LITQIKMKLSHVRKLLPMHKQCQVCPKVVNFCTQHPLWSQQPGFPENQVRLRSRILRQKPLFQGLEETLSLFRGLDGYKFTKLKAQSFPAIGSSSVAPAANKHFWLLFSRKTENSSDLVEAGCRVTSIVSADLNEDEQQLDLISDLISRNIDKLNIFQLKEVLYSLTFMYAQYRRFSTFATLIDVKLSQLIQELTICKDDIDTLLEICFIQLRWALLTSPYRMDMATKDLKPLYTTCLLERLLEDNLDLLNSEQLVFCIFLVGISRQYPKLPYKEIPDSGFPLPSKLGNKLEQVLSEIGPLEVGIICHGLHMSYLNLAGKKDVPLIQHLYKALLEFPDQNVQKHQLTISSIAKILKNRGGLSSELAKRGLLKYEEHRHWMDA